MIQNFRKKKKYNHHVSDLIGSGKVLSLVFLLHQDSILASPSTWTFKYFLPLFLRRISCGLTLRFVLVQRRKYSFCRFPFYLSYWLNMIFAAWHSGLFLCGGGIFIFWYLTLLPNLLPEDKATCFNGCFLVKTIRC